MTNNAPRLLSFKRAAVLPRLPARPASPASPSAVRSTNRSDNLCWRPQITRPLRPRSNAINTGAPTKAIIAPTGNCRGLTTVRANKSAVARIVPPSTTDAGATTR